MSGRKTLRRKLERARRRHTDIEIVRRPKSADSISGFVVGVGEHWVMVFVDHCGSPDGYEVVRLRDIKRIDKRVDVGDHRHRFLRRSLKRHGAWPPSAPDMPIDLDGSAREVIESAAAAAPLVTIHVEGDDSACYIGRPTRWGARKFRFHEVNPCGDWDNELYSYRIDSIIRVYFGDIYNTNLAAVAGPEPDL